MLLGRGTPTPNQSVPRNSRTGFGRPPRQTNPPTPSSDFQIQNYASYPLNCPEPEPANQRGPQRPDRARKLEITPKAQNPESGTLVNKERSALPVPYRKRGRGLAWPTLTLSWTPWPSMRPVAWCGIQRPLLGSWQPHRSYSTTYSLHITSASQVTRAGLGCDLAAREDT